MKTILCYGDSNTFGYVPKTGLRYDRKTRWTGLLAELLGPGFQVIEEGLNGRTTVFPDPKEDWKCGLYSLKPVLNSHKPLDLVVIFLGSNDLKDCFGASAEEIAEGACRLGLLAKDFLKEKQGFAPQILLVSPMVLGEQAALGRFGNEFSAASVKTSEKLADAFQAVCRREGFAFLDAAGLASSSPADGLHLSAESHKSIAMGMAETIRSLLQEELWYFGIDIGGTRVKTGLFSADGALVVKSSIPTEKGSESLFPAIADHIRTLALERGIPLASCRVGMGIAGPIDKKGYLEVGVNLGLKDLYPAKLLSRLLDGIPVFAANDANAAALGEQWQGGGKGFSDIAFVTLGTGVGAGLTVDGKLLHGIHGLCGEIGHIHIDDSETKTCTCGAKGCLEQKTSASGLVSEAEMLLKESAEPSVLRGQPALDAKMILDAAREGDLIAGIAADHCMEPLGRVLASLFYITDPEAIVIGGGLSGAGTYLLELIRTHFMKYPRLRSVYPEFRLAQLGNDAGIYGAARLAMIETGSY